MVSAYLSEFTYWPLCRDRIMANNAAAVTRYQLQATSTFNIWFYTRVRYQISHRTSFLVNVPIVCTLPSTSTPVPLEKSKKQHDAELASDLDASTRPTMFSSWDRCCRNPHILAFTSDMQDHSHFLVCLPLAWMRASRILSPCSPALTMFVYLAPATTAVSALATLQEGRQQTEKLVLFLPSAQNSTCTKFSETFPSHAFLIMYVLLNLQYPRGSIATSVQCA